MDNNLENKMIFANNLKKQMELKGKTRNDICQALNISYFTVSDWVNGKKYPRMDKVERLAEYFGVLKSDLIEEKTFKVKDKVNKSIGGSIQTFREKANMSTQRLSELLNIDEKDVYDIENGRYSVDKELLFRICDVFQTTPDVLDGSFFEMVESGDPDAEYRYSRQKNSPAIILTEEEQIFLKAFRKLPDVQKQGLRDLILNYDNNRK